MKILAKFLGKVTKYNPPPDLSYVILKSMTDGKVVETDADSTMLSIAGANYDNCEFEALVQMGDDGKIFATTTKLEPRKESVAPLIENKPLVELQPHPLTNEEKERIEKLEARIKELEAMLLPSAVPQHNPQ